MSYTPKNDDVSQNMKFVPSDTLADVHIDICEELRGAYVELAELIEDNLPHSRTRALALTNLEQSLAWAINATVHSDEAKLQ